MLSKKQEKLVRSLAQKKFRLENRMFIAEGKKLFEEGIRSGVKPLVVFATEFYSEKNKIDWEYQLLTEAEMTKISRLKTPPGLLAIFPFVEIQAPKSELILALDNVKDPGNLGTIIRTAEGFGVGQILCSENCTELFNPKLVQSSMGSIFRMPIKYTNLEKAFEELSSSHLLLGASLQGQNLYESEIKLPLVLVMGSESHGLSPEIEASLDKTVRIPQQGELESMNVSIATAILLSDLARRKVQLPG